MSEQDRYLNDIASLLTHLAPGCWELADFNYRAVGTSYEKCVIGGGLAHPRELRKHNDATPAWMNDTEALLPRSGVYPIVRELRSRMYEEGDGTWLEMNLKVHCRPGRTSLPDGDTPLWEVRYQGVEEITWTDEIPPSPAAQELQMFPQEPHRIPEWMSRLAAVQEPADLFDATEFLRSPQAESELAAALPAGLETLFSAARDRLLGILPQESAGRFLIGRLADGCWSVLHAAPAWLAVRMEDGACVEKHAYADPAAAVAFAVGAVLAEAGAEVNSSVLRGAGALITVTDRKNHISAWTLPGSDKNGSRQYRASLSAERPQGAAARGRQYFSLSPLHNRPGGYFVVQPGAVPAQGDFVSTHQIFEWFVGASLSKPTAPRPGPGPDDAGEPPSQVVLEVGTELDAYDWPTTTILAIIGTPFERRHPTGYPEDHPYYVFRVQRPLRATPIVMESRTVYRPGERGPKRLPDERGQIYGLERSIMHFVETGDLVRISGPGGDPVPQSDDYWDLEE
ncbi:TNT domain-containing protein [Spirillospora sp. NBC_00431]